MSTTTPTPRTVRVTRLFRAASDEHRAAGRNWYADAFGISHTLADKYSISAESAAGIIAALSPLNSWGHNVTLADRLIANGGLSKGYLTVGLRKANAILAGADPMDILKSDKVRNFYLSISTNGKSGVTIDRHAWAIATGVRGSDGKIGRRAYRAASDTYVRAADILSRETGAEWYPAQVQAATWVAHRARFWAPGAWDRQSVA